jgi:FG-GAP-like repeat
VARLAAPASPPGQPVAPSPASPSPEGQRAPANEAAGSGSVDAAGSAAGKSAPAGAPVQPDGPWLKDEKGKLYRVEKVRKIERQYTRIDGHTVRTVWGIPIEVVREDDQYFYFKVYKLDARPQPVVNPQPTAEELAKVAASYKVDTPESHRLQFADFGKGLPSSGQWREGFVLADLNGDGHLDIVLSPPRKGLSPPVIFLGDGKGGWRRWREAEFAPFGYDYGDVAVADLDGDGQLDLVLAMHLKGFTALLGDGQGHFTRRWDKGLDFLEPGKGADESAVFSSRSIAVVNWNRDRRPDILALGEGPRLSLAAVHGEPGAIGAGQSNGPVLYLNQGDGSWKRRDQGTGRDQVFGDSLTVGDFNGDGLPDFAVGSGIMGRRDLVYLGRADGGWDRVEIDVRPGSYVRSVLAADFDHDGRSDLAVGYVSYDGGVWRSGIDVFYSRPEPSGAGNPRGGAPAAGGGRRGTRAAAAAPRGPGAAAAPGIRWQRRTLAVKEGREGVSALGAGDLDGDGNLDLVALTGEGDTWVFLGDGKGFFTRETAAIPNYGPGCSGSRVRLADLDGDGKDEIVATWAGEYSPMNAPEACRSEGGIRAWHAVPAAGAAAAAAAPGTVKQAERPRP